MVSTTDCESVGTGSSPVRLMETSGGKMNNQITFTGINIPYDVLREIKSRGVLYGRLDDGRNFLSGDVWVWKKILEEVTLPSYLEETIWQEISTVEVGD